MNAGESLLAFTDGVTEARHREREFFTEEGLLALLTPSPPAGPELLECIDQALQRFVEGTPPSDDLTILAAWRCAD